MWLPYFKEYFNTTLPEHLKRKPKNRKDDLTWNYKDDLCMIGASDLAAATGDPFWEQAIRDVAGYLVNDQGVVPGWQRGEHNLDKISFGKSLHVLMKMPGYEYCRQLFVNAWEMLQDHPRTPRGNLWHKDIYPNQVWLDGLYMAMPFYALCVTELDAGSNDIFERFAEAKKLLWVPEKKLYIHACDESGQAEWADPKTGQSPCFWLRSEGWLLMALVDTYELLHGSCARAPELCAQLREAVDGLLPYTDEKSGMLLQLIDRADLPDNYPETSGSAMVAYALMKGSRLGMLPESYGRAGSDMLDAIKKLELRQGPDGIHLYGICASAGLGPGPDNRTDRTGTAAYYLSEKQIPDNEHGTAACMMAVSEQILREKAQ